MLLSHLNGAWQLLPCEIDRAASATLRARVDELEATTAHTREPLPPMLWRELLHIERELDNRAAIEHPDSRVRQMMGVE